MIDTFLFGESLKNLGFDFFSGVPCSYQTSLINYAINHCDFIMSPNEGDAVAICSGAYLANKKPVVLMQNSGLGNAISPLTSLNQIFNIPVMGFISHRGKPGTEDEPQHKLMGQITTDLLDLIKIDWEYLSAETDEAIQQLSKANKNIENGHSFFFVLSKNTFDEHLLIDKNFSKKEITSRNDVLKLLINLKTDDTSLLCTTGKTGREMFEIDDIKNNFYMIGSMGCISSLALGLSLNSQKKSIVIDGDGSLLMRMGNLPTIGYYNPSNILHLLLDNNSHDSTGGQFTVSENTNFVELAKNSGYDLSHEVNSLKELELAVVKWRQDPKLTFLRYKISQGSKSDLGRPTKSPTEIAERFKNFINDGK